MAQLNRTEVKAQVTAEITPTVTIAKHTGLLNDDFADNTIFKKDVITALTGQSGAVACDFESIDQYTIATTGNITITPSNLADGQICKIIITKGATTHTVSWAGITGSMDGKQIGLSSLSFYLWSANSKVYAVQLNRQSSGSIGIGDLTVGTSQTLNTVDYFDYYINDNIITIKGKLVVTASAAIPVIQIYLSASREFGTFKTTEGYQVGVNLFNTLNKGAKGLLSDNGTNYTFAIYNTDGTIFANGTANTFYFTAIIPIK